MYCNIDEFAKNGKVVGIGAVGLCVAHEDKCIKLIPFFKDNIKNDSKNGIFDKSLGENVEVTLTKKLSHIKSLHRHVLEYFDSGYIGNVKLFLDELKQSDQNNEEALEMIEEFEQRLQSEDYIDKPVRYICEEYVEDGTLADLAEDQYIGKEEWLTIIFQVVFTLASIQKEIPHFRHNDLHAGNILIKRIPYQKLTYRFGPKKWSFKTDICIKIMDFDWGWFPKQENIKLDDEDKYGRMGIINDCYDLHGFLNLIKNHASIDDTNPMEYSHIANVLNRLLPNDALFNGERTPYCCDFKLSNYNFVYQFLRDMVRSGKLYHHNDLSEKEKGKVEFDYDVDDPLEDLDVWDEYWESASFYEQSNNRTNYEELIHAEKMLCKAIAHNRALLRYVLANNMRMQDREQFLSHTDFQECFLYNMNVYIDFPTAAELLLMPKYNKMFKYL